MILSIRTQSNSVLFEAELHLFSQHTAHFRNSGEHAVFAYSKEAKIYRGFEEFRSECIISHSPRSSHGVAPQTSLDYMSWRTTDKYDFVVSDRRHGKAENELSLDKYKTIV